jgi:hypothetical protein
LAPAAQRPEALVSDALDEHTDVVEEVKCGMGRSDD